MGGSLTKWKQSSKERGTGPGRVAGGKGRAGRAHHALSRKSAGLGDNTADLLSTSLLGDFD